MINWMLGHPTATVRETSVTMGCVSQMQRLALVLSNTNILSSTSLSEASLRLISIRPLLEGANFFSSCTAASR